MSDKPRAKLGDFTFERFEIPESLTFGGEQAIAAHQLVGGRRVLNAMGRRDAPIEWSGVITGPEAVVRARRLDAMRADGRQRVFSFGEFRYPVVIASFVYPFEGAWRIPYSIALVIATGAALPPQETTKDALTKDMAQAQALGAEVDDHILTDALDTLDSAIQEVSDFANAAQDTINSVLQPIGAVMTRVQDLITTTTNTVGNVVSLGGILPANPIAQQVGGLLGNVTKYTSLPPLYALQSTMGRMSTNVKSAATAGRTVTTAGGNLYQVAAAEYGDPAAWAAVAKANGITDPKVAGVRNLVIPKNPGKTGGVLKT